MIKVVSGLCGSGKSTRMLDKINESIGDVRWLFITPYLDEVNVRVPLATPNVDWHIPQHKGKGKLGDLHNVLKKKKDIVSTHALFKTFKQETVDLIVHYGYTLVIDEAIDCIGQLDKKICNGSDVQALTTGEFVIIHEDNSVTWNEDKYPLHEGKYIDVRNMCNLGVLQSFRGSFIMWQYPDMLLAQIKECYILTYMFQGSTMRAWLDVKEIEYEYVDPVAFGLRPEEELKDILRSNLTIVDNRSLAGLYKNQTRTTFSNKWYLGASAEKIKILKGMIRSAVVTNKLNKGDIFWTCFKNAYERMKGVGYTKGCSDKGLAYIPWNIKATNNFKDHGYCVYGVNVFKSPTEVAYMESLGVSVESNEWALSEMIQFIFRGSIRENKPMKLMIFSKRMRKLLEDWLYG